MNARSLFFLSLFGSLLGVSSGVVRADSVPTQPSHVSVVGHQLMVQKRLPDGTLDVARPYIMKGINWSPAAASPPTGPDPNNPNQTIAYGCFYNRPDAMNYWLENEIAASYQQDIPLMQQLNVNTVRVYSNVASDPATANKILDAFYQAGIMVVMTVASSATDFTSGQATATVQQVMNHPAILMWSLGNEWNLNLYYGSYQFTQAGYDQAITATQNAAIAVKAVDANHPVSSSIGDIWTIVSSTNVCQSGITDSDIPTIVSSDTAVDIWGLNIYRGASFGNLFTQWATTTSKPFFFGEFGTDSFSTTQYNLPFSTSTNCALVSEAAVTAGAENQATQSSFNLGLWNEIVPQLSALTVQTSCVGGNVFEFSDEIWKVGNYNVNLGGLGDNGLCNSYNPDGFYLPGLYPDNIANEEYHGIVTATRTPKTSYTSLASFYQTLAPLQVPVIDYFNPPSASAGGPGFSLTVNGSNFASNAYVIWNGIDKTTTFLNSTQLQIPITAADITQSGNVTAYVVNPSTTGARSAGVNFPVQQIGGLNATRVSPSPWRSDRHTGIPITFDQMPPGSSVKIFTLSGSWVVTLQAPSGFANWTLQNGDGKTVASGLYLFVVTDAQGNTSRGKFAIIR